MNTAGRPLSPHLTIYRWPITMVLSILHRITGLALAVGFVAFAWWLAAIAFDAAAYERFIQIMGGFPGRLMLLGWLFAFFFHLANGIRHLIWDSGRMLEKHQADASAWFVVIAAVALTTVYLFVV